MERTYRYRQIERHLGPLIIYGLVLIEKVKGFLKRNGVSEPEKERLVRKILAIKAGSSIGDIVVLIPSLRALRRSFPHAQVTMYTATNIAQLMNQCPYVDKVIPFDFISGLKSPYKVYRFIRMLREESYDLVLDFEQTWYFTSVISYLIGARERVGFQIEGFKRSFLYTKPVFHKRSLHERDNFLNIVKEVDVQTEDDRLELWCRDEDSSFVENLLREPFPSSNNRLLVVIHPGCAIPRQWSPEKFAKLADWLYQKYGALVAITGAKWEIKLVDSIIKSMVTEPLSLTGKLDLLQLIALVKRAALVVCPNTSIMHIASAVGTPTVALHGPTDPKRWGPLGENHIIVRKDLPCSPCYYLGFEYQCQNYSCMNLISVEEVMTAVQTQLAKGVTWF